MGLANNRDTLMRSKMQVMQQLICSKRFLDCRMHNFECMNNYRIYIYNILNNFVDNFFAPNHPLEEENEIAEEFLSRAWQQQLWSPPSPGSFKKVTVITVARMNRGVGDGGGTVFTKWAGGHIKEHLLFQRQPSYSCTANLQLKNPSS